MGKRILITSIPSWNQKSGSNTFSTLFKTFDSKDIANIYIRPERPDSIVCSRYFNIREWQVLRSIIKRGEITGSEVIRQDDILINNNELVKEQEKTKYYSRNRKKIFLWMRELAWKLGKWQSKELNTFLDDFNPDILVFPIESYFYFNSINKYIIKYCKPKKIIGYLWDDNFTYKQYPNNISYLIERFFLRKQVKKLVGECTEILAISPKMKEECDKEFGINSTILTKPLRESSIRSYKYQGGIIRLLYTGSLVIGRDRTIKNIAFAVNKINETGNHLQFDIYTNTAMNLDYINEIDKCKGCKIHEAIPQNQVFIEQEKSDILIFCESLEKGNNVARLSFSTKITDYLSCHRCIFAIGPRDNSSIEYFQKEDAAITCSNNKDIYSTLDNIIHNTDIIEKYAEKAYLCGYKNHNPDVICKKLKNIIYG